MTFCLLRQIYEKIANIGKQTLHKESEEFNMKKKVLSVILAAVCTMGLMAGCGAEGSKGSTQSGAKGDSYTVGISQFEEHGSLDNCREGFLEGLKEEGIEFENTEVGVILTGSEEAGLRGAKAWCAAHKGEFDDVPTFIFSYDTIHDPKYLMTNYRDLNGTVKADKDVSDLFMEAAKELDISC